MESERYQKGLNRLREVDDQSPICSTLSTIAPDLNRFVVEFAYGDVHSRPRLNSMNLREW